MHPFRPPASRPASTRSKESPMDFTYETPPNSSFSPQKSQAKPLNVGNSNGVTLNSWLTEKTLSSTEEPQRKRAHYEVETMDWEACPGEAKNSPKPNLFPNIVTKPSEPKGGKFLFNPPEGLMLPPTSSRIASPTKLQPESFGLKHRFQTTFETDADTSVESVPLKLYSHNGVKHEERRRRQRNLMSKLNQMSVDSDGESGDQTSEDEPEDRQASHKLDIVRSRARSPSKAPRTTTHNHLTIHGWGPRSEPTMASAKSQLATETPYVLLVYLQLIFNASLVALALYLIFNFVLIMRTDVDSRIQVQTKRLRQEVEICANEYRTNRCFPLAERTKFIEQHCIEWERCMNQNPSQLSRLKIGAETFAEVMNGFVDVISLKTMVFILAVVGAGIWATNLAMNSYKAKWNPAQYQPHPSSKAPQHVRPSPLGWAPSAQEFDPAAIFGAATNHQTSRSIEKLAPASPRKRAVM